MDETGAIEPLGEYRALHEVVLHRLRDAILEGRLTPGARLKVRDVAARLDVSPMPVREALHLLEVEGLARRLPRRGVVVSELTPDGIVQAYDLMGAIGGLAAASAAGALTAADLDALAAHLSGMDASLAAGDRDALLAANRVFHARIAAAYASPWADDFLRRLWNHTYRVRRLYPNSPARLRQAAREHRALLDALRAADGARAERLAREHNANACADLLGQLEASAPAPPGVPAAVPVLAGL